MQLSTLIKLLSITKSSSGTLTITPDYHIENGFKICIDELTEIGLAALVVGELKESLEVSDCNKVYSKDGKLRAPGFKSVQKQRVEIRGTEPYYAPNGWMRHALNLGLSTSEFQQRFANWPIYITALNSRSLEQMDCEWF